MFLCASEFACVCFSARHVQKDFTVVLLSNAPAVSRQLQRAIGQKERESREAEGRTAPLKER